MNFLLWTKYKLMIEDSVSAGDKKEEEKELIIGNKGVFINYVTSKRWNSLFSKFSTVSRFHWAFNLWKLNKVTFLLKMNHLLNRDVI